MECDGHYLHIENQATKKTCNVKDIVLEPPVKLWNLDTHFGRARNTSTILQICQLSGLPIEDENFAHVHSQL